LADARDWKIEMIDWLLYPNSDSADAEFETITWNDLSTDEVPSNYFGEGIFELPTKFDTALCVSWYLLHNPDDIYRVEFPRMLSIPEGPTILRFDAEDEYLTALICQSRDQTECLQSWLKGESKIDNESDEFFSLIGQTDYPVREVLAFIGSGLLDDVQPMYIQQSSNDEKVSVYSTALFDPAFYNFGANLDVRTYAYSAVSVEKSIGPDVWEKLLAFCFEGSIAQKIQNDVPSFRQRWDELVTQAEAIAPEWEVRLNGNAELYVEDFSGLEIVWGLDTSGKELFLGESEHINAVLADKDLLETLAHCGSWSLAKDKLGIRKINEIASGLLDSLWEEHCEENEFEDNGRPTDWLSDSLIDLGDEHWQYWAQVRDPNSQGAPNPFYVCGSGGSNMMRGDFWSWSIDDLPQLTQIASDLGCIFTQRQDLFEQIIDWR
jgi:hypothetical protein